MKKKIKIAFLILHYNTVEDTEKCVKSIEENITDNYHIVIVDNFSPNGSGPLIFDKYKNNNRITVILSKKNEGFARGNNLGFEYIKKNFDVEFIAMINNDTYLLHNNFIKLIDEEYSKSNFAVLGPKILLPNNKVNPIQENLIGFKVLKKRRFRFKINYICNLLYLQNVYELIKKVFLKITNKKIENQYSLVNVNKRMENIVLHGAFLIFSKVYINKFDGLDNRTFMYMEEKLLSARLKKYQMKSVYNPEIEIFHNEDSATNSVMKTSRAKNLFIYKNAIKSSKILLKELENLNEN